MLAAAALRLAAVEALCPTSAIAADGPWPTLARDKVFDSVTIAVEDLDSDQAWTPTLSVYTEDTRVSRRGDVAPSTIGNARTDLIIVAELSERADDAGTPFVDAKVDGDAKTRLVLDALTAQVRACLVRAPDSAMFRRIMKSVDEIRIEPFSLPQFGIRYLRNVITFTCSIADDKFTDDGGFPEPIRSIAAEMPDGSYAKGKLAELAALFAATDRQALDGIAFRATVDGNPVSSLIP